MPEKRHHKLKVFYDFDHCYKGNCRDCFPAQRHVCEIEIAAAYEPEEKPEWLKRMIAEIRVTTD